MLPWLPGVNKSAATFLARGGLRVALFEREIFPRFHVGESLMPAVMVRLKSPGAFAMSSHSRAM